jgi:hypothetical protein
MRTSLKTAQKRGISPSWGIGRVIADPCPGVCFGRAEPPALRLKASPRFAFMKDRHKWSADC